MDSSENGTELLEKLVFDPPIGSKYDCPICLQLLKIPYQTSCGHRFCKKCIFRWIGKKQGRCPSCQKLIKYSELFPDIATQRDIESLTVQCLNSSKGCEERLELGLLSKHVQHCSFSLQPCPAGCGQRVPQIRVDAHLKHDCSHRTVTCPSCRQLLKFFQYKPHTLECPRSLVSCMFCKHCMFQEELSNHLVEMCTDIPLACFFQAFGCAFVGRRAEHESHQVTSCAHHLLLLVTFLSSCRVLPPVVPPPLTSQQAAIYAASERQARPDLGSYDPVQTTTSNVEAVTTNSATAEPASVSLGFTETIGLQSSTQRVGPDSQNADHRSLDQRPKANEHVQWKETENRPPLSNGSDIDNTSQLPASSHQSQTLQDHHYKPPQEQRGERSREEKSGRQPRSSEHITSLASPSFFRPEISGGLVASTKLASSHQAAQQSSIHGKQDRLSSTNHRSSLPYKPTALLEQRLWQLESAVETLRCNNENLQVQVSELQALNCSGTFLYRLNDLRSLCGQALADKKTTIINTPGFYTGPGGYKASLRINIDAKRPSEDSEALCYGNIGLFIHLLKGPYDDSLTWPVIATVRMALIQQCFHQPSKDELTSREDLVETFTSKANLKAFQRPVEKRNPKGYGYMEFCYLENLEKDGFIKDDSLLFKINFNPVEVSQNSML